MNPPVPEEPLARIRATLQRSDKIEAIKVYREVLPVGLAEAKKAVEVLEAELFATDPAIFCSRRRRSRLVSGLMVLAYSLATMSMICLGMDAYVRLSHGEHLRWTQLVLPWFAAMCFTVVAITGFRHRPRPDKS